MFGVRQWPGNGADLDFRGVLEGCVGAVVVAAPFKGTLTQNGVFKSLADGGVHKARVQQFRKSDEYKAAAKVLPFCRLWYVCGAVTADGSTPHPVAVIHAYSPFFSHPTPHRCSQCLTRT